MADPLPQRRAGRNPEQAELLPDARAAGRRGQGGTASETRHRGLQHQPRARRPADAHGGEQRRTDAVDAGEERGARFDAEAIGRGRRRRLDGNRRAQVDCFRATARGEVELDQVGSQHLDGANRQPRRAVLGARFRADARHLGSARAPVDDIDVDGRGARRGTELDDSIGVVGGRDRLQPGTRVGRARVWTDRALGERDGEPERQQLPVEPRDRFGQLG